MPEPFLDPISDQGHILTEKSYLLDGHAYVQVLHRSRLFFLRYVTLSKRQRCVSVDPLPDNLNLASSLF